MSNGSSPYVQGSKIRCELRLHLDTGAPTIQGYYVNIGRALVNIVSNALDAIEETGRKGIIDILLRENGEFLTLTIADNGAGMPKEFLELNKRGLPRFVGRTTKGNKTGEGLGTQQIYSTFGAENIEVTSRPGQGTSWNIRFAKHSESVDTWFVRMNRRYSEFKDLWEVAMVGPKTPRREVVAYIWQIRKIEIFLFDLILRFSRYPQYPGYLSHYPELSPGRLERIRFRSGDCRLPERHREAQVLALRYQQGDPATDGNSRGFGGCRQLLVLPLPQLRPGLPERDYLHRRPRYGGVSGYRPQIGGASRLCPLPPQEKDQLLRGEFLGDLNIHENPIHFGIWTVSSMPDALEKLKMIRRGAATFIGKGIHPEKRLAFYHTTYVKGEYDLDINKTSTFGEFAHLSDGELKSFVTRTENELEGYILGRE